MRKLFLVVLLVAAMAIPASAATPLHVIFDTDMGNDVDDALALAMLHAFASRGELKLLAVTVSKDNPWAAEYVRMVDEYYGRGAIPVGIVHDGKTQEDGLYVKQICELHHRRPNKAAVADAVQLLRKTLAGEPGWRRHPDPGGLFDQPGQADGVQTRSLQQPQRHGPGKEKSPPAHRDGRKLCPKQT